MQNVRIPCGTNLVSVVVVVTEVVVVVVIVVVVILVVVSSSSRSYRHLASACCSLQCPYSSGRTGLI